MKFNILGPLLQQILSPKKPHSHPTGFYNDHGPSPQPKACSGQSYKHFTLVIYDSRVVPDLKLPHITTLES